MYCTYISLLCIGEVEEESYMSCTYIYIPIYYVQVEEEGYMYCTYIYIHIMYKWGRWRKLHVLYIYMYIPINYVQVEEEGHMYSTYISILCTGEVDEWSYMSCTYIYIHIMYRWGRWIKLHVLYIHIYPYYVQVEEEGYTYEHYYGDKKHQVYGEDFQ